MLLFRPYGAEEAEAEEAEPEAEEVVIEAEPDEEEDERHAFEIICEQLGVHVVDPPVS